MPMRQVTPRQLRVLETARYLSCVRAAGGVAVGQAAREHVGIEPFGQIGKRVHLIEVGRKPHHYIREITRQLAEAKAEFTRLNGLEAGHPRLVAVRTAKYYAQAVGAVLRNASGALP